MSRNISKAMLAMACFTLISMGFTLAARAQACSLSQTAGKWGVSTNGTVVGIGPRQSVATFTLDAAGNVLHGKGTASLNGTVTDEIFSGTYTVNPDCTGTMTVEFFDASGNKTLAATGDLVFVQDMRELLLIYKTAVLPDGTALAPVIVVDGKRINEQ
jgi:hypothetical protein